MFLPRYVNSSTYFRYFPLRVEVAPWSRRYPAETISDADNADDLALLTNTPAQAESFLHSLEQPAEGIRLNVNANKTEFMYLGD